MQDTVNEKTELPSSLLDEKLIIDETTSPETNLIIEEQQFTWRAAIIGSLLGCLVAASNMYLGLKIGWTFGASLFGAIFSFAILKPLSRNLPERFGGGYFGPKENCTAQSAATTTGGLSAGFISGIPALYKLGLMSTPKEDIVALVLFTMSAAFYGLFFAVPLRKHFVVRQNLTFPTPRAAAIAIISLHDTLEGEKEAMKKAIWMAFWFMVSFIWSLISYWIPFMDTIHILWWIGYGTNYTPMMKADQVWSWSFRWDFPFFGAGLMTPGSTVVPFFITSLVVYGIAGPSLVSSGYFIQPLGITDRGATTQSFFLWPGIAMMVLSSFSELFVRYQSLWRGIKGGITGLYNFFKQSIVLIKTLVLKKPYSESDKKIMEPLVDEEEIFTEQELVPTWWWVVGVFVSIVFTCAIMGEYFGMPVYQSIVAVILGFLLSFVGVQAEGETDINPAGAIAKTTQLIFAAMPADSVGQLRENNIMAGNIAVSASSQAIDMVGDLKTGQLVGASPRSQFLAQLVASVFAIGISVGLFILFTSAYPCIVSTDIDAKCEFGLVGVMSWYNTTLLLTGGSDPLTKAGINITIVFGVLGLLGPFIREFLVPKKYHHLFPSLSVVGIAMINTSPQVPISMFIGWLSGKIWERIDRDGYDRHMHSAAGGMIAGQGISAIIQALLKLGGVSSYPFVGSCMYQDFNYCP